MIISQLTPAARMWLHSGMSATNGRKAAHSAKSAFPDLRGSNELSPAR